MMRYRWAVVIGVLLVAGFLLAFRRTDVNDALQFAHTPGSGSAPALKDTAGGASQPRTTESSTGDAADPTGTAHESAVHESTAQKSTAADPAPATRRQTPAANPIDWDAEELSQQVTTALKTILHFPLDGEASDESVLAQVAVPQVVVGQMRPLQMEEKYRDEALRINVPAHVAAASPPSIGVGMLRDELIHLARPFAGATEQHLKFKVIRVIKSEVGAETHVLYQAAGQTKDGFLQQDGSWHCNWVPGPQGVPRLAAVKIEGYRETRTMPGNGPLFSECTEAVLGANEGFYTDLIYSGSYWRKRLAKSFNPGRGSWPGIAVGDVDGDGLQDVYLCAMVGLPNRLFLQQPDGTAIDVAPDAGVDFLDGTRAALLVDLDNDGDQDLALVTKSHTLFLANDGAGHFEVRASLEAPRMRMSLSATDYDNDGDLDVYICRYGLFVPAEVDAREFTKLQFALGIPNPTFDANNGDPNSLLRNDGDFRFTEVTEQSGLDENNRRFSFAAAWEDYDNDGDQDLYVANDYGRNNLYRNDNGQFSDVAPQAGVEDLGSGMGVTWADFNDDGWVDLYVSNMFSGAGNRIGLQPEWEQYLRESKGDERAAKELSDARRAMKGNSLYLNQGDGTFRDVTDVAGVALAMWSWGGVFMDINNDGREDLVVPNGFLTNEKTKDL